MRIIILLLLVGTLQAQNYHTFNVPVSVGGATNASSLLTLNSTTQGFLIPRMTTAQRDAIPTPAVGLQIYNTETNTINIYNGTWVALSGGGGIGGTIAAGQVAFGSASNTLSGSNNLFWDSANNRLGVGLTNPSTVLQIKGTGTTSATSSFRIENSDATRTATFTDDGVLKVTNTAGIGGPVGAGEVIISATSPFIRSFYGAGHGGVITMDISGPFPAARFTATSGYQGGLSTENAAAILARKSAANSVGVITEGLIVKESSNTTPMAGYNTSALLDIQSTTRGFLLPRMTTAQRDAIVSPATALSVYNTTTNTTDTYDGTAWQQFGRSTVIRGGSTANTSLSFLTQNSSATNTFSVGDAGRVTIYKDTESSGTQSSARLMVESGDANTNLVLSPKGTGAFILGPAPDASGNARGANAVDLQRVRNTASKVASGSSSAILGGSDNTASGLWSIVVGGSNSTASGQQSFVGGGGNNTSAALGAIVVGGYYNVASADFSSALGGFGTRATLYGQDAYASGHFNNFGDNQTSNIRLRNTVSNSTTELFLNAASSRAVLTPPSGNGSRVWNARLQCVAVTNVQGTGGPAVGSVFSETMDITIKRIGTVTSIVNGTPMQSVSVSDIGMSGADFLVDADDTNEALRVRFQPPSIAAADTQIRAVCTVYLTEIGY